ncbi:MAG: NAD(P)H-dependent oxidoreductase [Desulfatiglans sp.]|nr:NAD(P)H-dependent oxidoreductase [Thermodesulfobacteriota bacterium]MEE4353600.1 NAD(P)H-dependent oxidoreductase [Desulfatiglans sp.]
MKISLIIAHPDRGSFNFAIAKRCFDTLVRNGHTVFFHDLYGENFEAILPLNEIPRSIELPEKIQKHCSEISTVDGIIIVHPNWWGQPPAILKGWIDRVIRPGVAYEFIEGDSGEGVPVGLLRAKSALVFNTSNTESTRESETFKDPLETIWKNCVFGLCGVSTFYRRMFNIIVTSSEKQRIVWLREVEETVDRYYPSDKTPEQSLAAEARTSGG